MTKYLTEVKPELPPGNKDAHVLASVEAWVHGDYLCKGHILHCLVNELYDVYSETNNSKYLWEALEKKYKVFNVGSSQFATANYLNYKMVDSRPIMEQLHELQLIFQGIADEGMRICEMLTVNSIVEKLPPSWDDFKNYLCYKQKPLSLLILVSRLQNEANKREKTGSEFTHDENVVEYRRKGKGKVIPNKMISNKFAPQSSKGFKKQTQAPKGYNFKKFSGKCNHCGKIGHNF